MMYWRVGKVKDVRKFFLGIKNSMSNPDMLYVDTIEFFEKCECYEVTTESGNLIGYVTLLTPGENGSDYDFDTIAIDNHKWGQGLATQIIGYFVNEVYPNKTFRCTIHPDNHGSRIAFERNGFILYKEGEAYDGLRRCYYERKVN